MSEHMNIMIAEVVEDGMGRCMHIEAAVNFLISETPTTTARRDHHLLALRGALKDTKNRGCISIRGSVDPVEVIDYVLIYRKALR